MILRLMWAGRRVVNLEFLISAEPCDLLSPGGQASPDDVRVTMLEGVPFYLKNGEAAQFMRGLAEVIMADYSAGETASPIFGRSYDPETGQPRAGGESQSSRAE